MNCILLSGGLFQIYSNHKENYLSYRDMMSKVSEENIKEYPNIKGVFNKYVKIKSEIKNISETNEVFLKQINNNNDINSFNLFEKQKDNFETISLPLFYSFIKKFKKVYFYYDNLLYLLFDLNIFNLL